MDKQTLDQITKDVARQSKIIAAEIKKVKTKLELVQVGQRVANLNYTLLALMKDQDTDYIETGNENIIDVEIVEQDTK